MVQVNPGYIEDSEGQQLLDDIGSCKTLDAIELRAVDEIRRVAAASTAVGRNCMCITIAPLPHGPVRVRYMPREPEFVLVPEGGGMKRVPATYSPWIVAPGGMSAPSITFGSGGIGIGDLKVSIEMMTPPGKTNWIMASQPRKQDPHHP